MRPLLKLLFILLMIYLPETALCQQDYVFSKTDYPQESSAPQDKTYFCAGVIWGLNFTALTGYDDWSYKGPNLANIGGLFRLTRKQTIYEIDIIALFTGVRFNESNQTSMGIQGGTDRQVNENIMVPVLLGRYFGDSENTGFFIKGGVFVSHLQKATYKIPDNDALIIPIARTFENSEEFKTWDMGVSLATGIDGDWSGLDIRANWGLKDINNNPNDIWQYVDTSEPIRSILYQITWTVWFTYSKKTTIQ